MDWYKGIALGMPATIHCGTDSYAAEVVGRVLRSRSKRLRTHSRRGSGLHGSTLLREEGGRGAGLPSLTRSHNSYTLV